MFWKRKATPPTEDRGYTDAIVQAIIQNSGSGELVSAEQTSSLEIAAGVISRAFGAAAVEGPPAAVLMAGAPLADIGRDLITRGEAVYMLYQGRMRRASSWEISGSNVGEWTYSVQLPVPDGSRSEVRTMTGIAHPRYSSDRSRPWIGVGPLERAKLVGSLVGNMETRMGEEAGGSVGHVLPLPVDGQDPTIAQLKADLANLQGKTSVVESVAGGWGQGRAAAPAQEWTPKRLGATFSPATVPVYTATQLSVLAACGVPVELVHPSDGTGQREAWRRFLHGTVQPLARIVAGELGKATGGDVTITFEGLFASDIAGRARAFQSMVGGGLDIEEAARAAGLVSVDE